MYEPHYEEEPGGSGFMIGLLCGTALGAAIGSDVRAEELARSFASTMYDTTGDLRRKAMRPTARPPNRSTTSLRRAVRLSIEAGRRSKTPDIRHQARAVGMAARPSSEVRPGRVYPSSAPADDARHSAGHIERVGTINAKHARRAGADRRLPAGPF